MVKTHIKEVLYLSAAVVVVVVVGQWAAWPGWGDGRFFLLW